MNIKYVNESHKAIINALLNGKACIKKPIMLTADQFEDKYTISCGWAATGITIPKSDVLDYELKEITDDDFGGRIVVNNVWEAKL